VVTGGPVGRTTVVLTEAARVGRAIGNEMGSVGSVTRVGSDKGVIIDCGEGMTVVLRDGRKDGNVIGGLAVPEVVPEDELAEAACVIEVSVTSGRVVASDRERMTSVPDGGGNVAVATSVMPTDDVAGVGEPIGVLLGSVAAAKDPVRLCRVFSTSEVSEVNGSAGKVFVLDVRISTAGVLLARLRATRGGNVVNCFGRTSSAVGTVFVRVLVDELVEVSIVLPSGTVVASRLFPWLPLCLCRCPPLCLSCGC
jgi:hypothetical protein